MLAIDTNVLVRYLTADHPEQAAAARKLVDTNDVWVATTVLLETGWVLRSVLKFDRSRVTALLRGFCGLPGVSLENPGVAAQALDWHDGGMDLADAFHLAASAGCDALMSFDRDFIKIAASLASQPVRQP